MTNHDRLFGATKIPFGGPPFGDTQNPREKLIPSHLEFYESRFALYSVSKLTKDQLNMNLAMIYQKLFILMAVMIATTTKATFLILTMFSGTQLVKAWQHLMYSLLMLTSCQVFKCANSSSVSQQNAKYLKPRRNSFSLSQFLKRKKNHDVQIIKLN